MQRYFKSTTSKLLQASLLSLSLMGCGDSYEQQIGQAQLALSKGQSKQALEYAQKALELKSDDIKALEYIASAQASLKQFDEAEKTIEKMSQAGADENFINDFKGQLQIYRVAVLRMQHSYILDPKKLAQIDQHLKAANESSQKVITKNSDENYTIKAFIRQITAFEIQAQIQIDKHKEIQKKRDLASTSDQKLAVDNELKASLDLYQSLLEKKNPLVDKILEIRPLHNIAFPAKLANLLSKRQFNEYLKIANDLTSKKEVPVKVSSSVINTLLAFPENIIAPEQAIALSQKLIDTSKNKNAPTIQIAQTNIYRIQKEYDKASTLIDKTIKRARGSQLQQAKAAKLLVLCATNKFDEALDISKKLVVEMKNNSKIQQLHASILVQNDQIDAAKSIYRTILQKSNYTDGSIVRQLFPLLDNEQKEELLFAYWDKAPRSPIAFNLAYQYYNQTDDADSIKDLITKIKSQEINSPALAQVAITCHLYLGDFDPAFELSNQTIKRWPEYIEGHSSLISVLIKQSKFDEAERAYENATKTVKYGKETLEKVKSEFYLRRGYVDKAESLLAQELKQNPSSIPTKLKYARALQRLQRHNQAVTQLNQVLELDEQNLQAHMLLHEIYTILNNKEKSNHHLSLIDIDKIGKSKRVAWLAEKTFASGDHAKAIQLCENEIASGNKDPQLNQTLFRIYRSQKNYDKAVQIIKSIIAVDNKNIANWNNLGLVLVGMNDLKKAENIIDQINTQNNKKYALYTLANIYNTFENYDQAIASLEKTYNELVKKKDTFSEIAAQPLANAYLAKGEYDKTTAVYQKLIDAGINHVETLYKQTIALPHNYDRKKLIDRAERILKNCNETHFAIRSNTITLLNNLKAYDNSLKWLNQWHTQSPEDIRYASMLTKMHLALGNPDQAVSVTQKNVSLNPNNHVALFNLAHTFVLTNQYPQAQEIFNKIAASDKGLKIRSLYELGMMYDKLGLRTQAAEIYEKLNSDQSTQDPRVLMATGISMQSIGQTDKAIEAFKKVPTYTLQYPGAQIAIARILQSQDKVTQAQAILKKLAENKESRQMAQKELFAMSSEDQKEQQLLKTASTALENTSLSPKQKAYWQNLQLMIAINAKDYPKALNLSKQILTLEPENPNHHAINMLLLLSQQQDDQAKSQFNKVKSQFKFSRNLQAIFSNNLPKSARPNPVVDFYIQMSQGQYDLATVEAYKIRNNPKIFSQDLIKEIEANKTSNKSNNAAYQNILKAFVSLEYRQPKLALTFIDRAIKLNPNLLTTHLIKLNASAIDKSLDTKEVLTQIAQKFPQTAIGQFYQAQLLVNQGKFTQAAAKVNDVLKIDPTNQAIQKTLAGVYLANNQPLEAIKKLEILLNFNSPYAVAAMNDWAYLVAKHQPKRLNEAQRFAQKAVKQYPNNHNLLDTLGWIEFKKGNHKTALKHLQKAILALSNHPSVHYHLGAAYAKNNQIDWAKHHLLASINNPKADKDEKAAAQKLLDSLK